MSWKYTWPLILLLALTIGALGCSSSSDSDTPPDGDTSPDGDNPDGDDPDGDEPDGDDPDGDTDGDGSGDECQYASDCTDKQDCVDGACVSSTTCIGPEDCEASQICWYATRETEIGRCRVFCSTDMDCSPELGYPEDSWCFNGLCSPYTPFVPGEKPAQHPEWNGKLHAQFAEGFLDFPFPGTMCGYGARKGPDSPYAGGMGTANGQYDRPDVRVLTLDDGEDRIVFVRLPINFPTDFYVNTLVKEVIALGGPDLSDNLVVTGSHTHSGVGSYWFLLPELGFGALGFGEFRYEGFTRVTKSAAKVIKEAQEDLKPAAFGYGINPNFDPDNRINRDRRSQNDPLKDPRLIVWRIDDLSSGTAKPWIVTMTLALHGTIEDQPDTVLTNDSHGGTEIMTQLLWEKEHPGETLHTMFFNGMAGDVSPASDDLRGDHTAQMSLLGTRVYRKTMELFESITPSDEVDLSIISKRIPISRDYIGYTDNEFYSDGVSMWEAPPGGPYRFGAFQCGLLNQPIEQNLDLYVYDAEGNELGASTVVNSKNNGETVSLNGDVAAGTYYIKVAGFDHCIGGYSISASTPSRTPSLNGDCIDLSCGRPCGTCPKASDLPAVACTEDAYEPNDDMDAATAIDLDTVYQNGQICTDNEDWFKVDLAAGQAVDVWLAFNQDTDAYNPDTMLKDGNLGCVLNIERMNHGPVPQFGKTRLTGIRLGDLYLGSLPGEPTSRIGLDTLTELEANTDFADHMVFGYCNDHFLYITSEHDWMQAGYNTEMSVWGPRYGEYLINHLTDLAVAISEGNEEESANEFPDIKPTNFADAVVVPFRVPAVTDAPTAASITLQPTDTRRMADHAVLSWVGGDAGVDHPHVYLETQNGDTWEPVLRPSGMVYDDRFYEINLAFANESFALPNKPDADTNNYWTAEWEETYSFPLGTYRFRVEGRYYNGSTESFDGETGVETYSFVSDAFDLLPIGFDIQPPAESTANVDLTAGTISGSIRYLPPMSNDDGVSAFDGRRNRAFLMHTEEVGSYCGPRPPADPAKTTVAIDILKASDESLVDTIDTVTLSEAENGKVYYVNKRDEGGVETLASWNGPLTLFSADLPDLMGGDYLARVSVTDEYGNSSVTDFAFTEVPE